MSNSESCLRMAENGMVDNRDVSEFHRLERFGVGSELEEFGMIWQVSGRGYMTDCPPEVKHPSHDWGALAKNPSLQIGATGEAWISAVRSAWLQSGGTEESFERTFPAYAAKR